MATNSITGDSISTKYGSREAQKNFENNFDSIFSKRKVLCDICKNQKEKTKNCTCNILPSLLVEQ